MVQKLLDVIHVLRAFVLKTYLSFNIPVSLLILMGPPRKPPPISTDRIRERANSGRLPCQSLQLRAAQQTKTALGRVSTSLRHFQA
jgi:hypothetical protein